ncbi:hypothetical protein K8R66_00280, partial [bacterium]|nr:hypothetical protein [bacterium]
AYNIGGTTYYNDNNGNSGSGYNIGGTTYYNDNNGNSGSAYNIGGTTYYNGNIFDNGTVPITQSCPRNSSRNSLSGRCDCSSGYVVDTNILGEKECVSGNSKCKSLLGYGSYYNSFKNQCECSSGYKYNGSGCEYEIKPYISDYSPLSTNSVKKDTCPTNSFLNSKNQCICNDGYLFNNNFCISYNDSCTILYGENSYGDKDYCYCGIDYQWNEDKTKCIKTELKPVRLESVKTNIEIDKTFSKKQSGKLFLQVEKGGRIWYVDTSGLKHEVTWTNLMNLFESLALGITNDDLNKIDIGDL